MWSAFGEKPQACIEDTVDTGQLREVGMNFMRSSEGAKVRHRPAGLLLTIAFAQAWPYSQEKPGRKS